METDQIIYYASLKKSQLARPCSGLSICIPCLRLVGANMETDPTKDYPSLEKRKLDLV